MYQSHDVESVPFACGAQLQMRLPEKRFINSERGLIARSDTVTVGKLAAVATVLAAALALFSSGLSTGQLREQNCIARIDSQEAKLREKASLLQGSLAEMIAVASTPEPNRLKYSAAVQQVMKSAYEMTAYTGTSELGLQALRVAEAARRGLSVFTEDDRKKAMREEENTFYDWPLYYSNILDDFEKKREACAAPLFSQLINSPSRTPTAPAP